MKKIPTIFKRDPVNRAFVTAECNPDCLWVFRGEGRVTRKLDGTCCLIQDHSLFKRREVKPGKPIPADFTEVDFDTVTGKRFGWVPVGDGPDDQYFREAAKALDYGREDGTYELVGPKVQGNPERVMAHVLRRHGQDCFDLTPGGCERTFEGIKSFLSRLDCEGIVFHHPDGRMGKIKKRDFGLTRNPVDSVVP